MKAGSVKPLPGHTALFRRVKGDREILIETGTFRGQGIASALESGYDHVISFEVVPELYEGCKEAFHGMKNVTLLLQSSASMAFVNIVKGLDRPAVFWLDAHFNGAGPSPLVTELVFIAASHHPHIALIDDTRLLKKYGVTEELLSEVLRASGREIEVPKETVRDQYKDDVLRVEFL